MNRWVKRVFSSIQRRFRERRINGSPPFKVELEGVSVRFSTDDSYSYHWFYPRYSEGEIHEPVATSEFMREAMDSRVICDVGSNLGWFSCIAARANPVADVFAFEIDEANCSIFRKNLKLNDLRNVTLTNAAVTSADQTVNYEKASCGASAMHRIRKSIKDGPKVTGVSLDSFFTGKPSPTLVKVDVEGAELEVLKGMSGLFRSSELETIFVEIHPTWISELGGSTREVLEILDNAGFVVKRLAHRGQSSAEYAIQPEELERCGNTMVVGRRR